MILLPYGQGGLHLACLRQQGRQGEAKPKPINLPLVTKQ